MKKRRRATKTVCFAANLFLWRDRTVPGIWWDSEEYTQAVTLTIHSLKAKSNVSICVEKKDYQLWHLSCNSHGRACLSASRAWKRSDFQGNATIKFDNSKHVSVRKPKAKAGRLRICQVYFLLLSRIPRKDLDVRVVHAGEISGLCNSSQSCGFQGLAHLAPSRFQDIQIYQHPHSHSAGDTHSSVSSVSFSLKILIFWWIWARPSPPPAHRMASTLSDLMRPNLHSKCYQNYH